jgi:hypothetical protein
MREEDKATKEDLIKIVIIADTKLPYFIHLVHIEATYMKVHEDDPVYGNSISNGATI